MPYQGISPTYGYFQSNKTGGVSDVVFVGDLNDGHYKMYFGIDPDADGIMDTKSPMIYANISMPCPQYTFRVFDFSRHLRCYNFQFVINTTMLF